MLSREIPVIGVTPPPLSIWRGIPKQTVKRHEHVIEYAHIPPEWASDKEEYEYMTEELQYLEIFTPHGVMTIAPHECTVIDIDVYLNHIGPDGYKIEYITGAAQKTFNERIFYLQQRGLKKHEAIRLMGGDNLKSRHLFYLLSTPGALGYFGFDWKEWSDTYYKDVSYWLSS